MASALLNILVMMLLMKAPGCKNGIALHQELFGKCTHHSADKIYATNANRKYCYRQKNCHQL